MIDDKIERWEDDIDESPKGKQEIDLSKVNEIDMDYNGFEDDDDSFGGIVEEKPSKSFRKEIPVAEIPEGSVEQADGRCLNTKTGIKISFDDDVEIDTKNISDDDIEIIQQKTISPESINTIKDEDLSGYNDIDMECNCCEDEDNDDYVPTKSKKEIIDFGDDEDEMEFLNQELVDESFKEEKELISQGQVENDYYDKLQKKHAKSNVKGAYNVHMHLGGNPEVAMADFNHDMGGSKATNVSSGASIMATDSTVAAVGMGEAKEENKYQKLFEELLLVTGFDMHKDNDGNIILSDRCNFTQPISCCNGEEVFANLKPYIEDSYIYPLQYQTKENFKDCADWCNWYNDEMKTKYPKLERDIAICDLVANHCNEVKF